MDNKIKAKLSDWEGQWLNHSGKLVLINYVLSSLPIYHMSVLQALKYFIDKTLKHLNFFVWRGKGNQKKFDLVNWNVVRRSKK